MVSFCFSVFFQDHVDFIKFEVTLIRFDYNNEFYAIFILNFLIFITIDILTKFITIILV